MTPPLDPLTLLCTLADGGSSVPFAVRMPDGPATGSADPAFTLVVRRPGDVAEALANPSWRALGEAYLSGAVDIDGDMEAVYALADQLRELTPAQDEGTEPKPDLDVAFRGAGEAHTIARDADAIAYHYDLPASVFQLITDPTVNYSCAYYSSPSDTLHEAQLRKMERTCRKLDLRDGERLLDIGCGWGGMALHAAGYADVDVTGVTISAEQLRLVQRRVAEAGLSDRVRATLCDYRAIDPAARFDKIVSLGMVEHVGLAELPTYFQVAWDRLEPGGRFLMQGVTSTWASGSTDAVDFTNAYLFPDAEMPFLTQYLQAGVEAGFEVRDVENMREHYALTHRAWRHNLEANRDAIVGIIGEERYRALRVLYSYSTHYLFVTPRCEVFQTVFYKPIDGEQNAYTWQRPV